MREKTEDVAVSLATNLRTLSPADRAEAIRKALASLDAIESSGSDVVAACGDVEDKTPLIGELVGQMITKLQDLENEVDARKVLRALCSLFGQAVN